MAAVEHIEFGGWSRCFRLTNGIIKLVVTGEVGPRIIRFGFVGGENEFYVDRATLGQTGGDEWHLYGGHRLWHAPEAQPRTYYPDNQPVTLEEHAGFVRVSQPVEPTTGIAKEFDFYLAENAAQVRVVHRLRNEGRWPVELAPWALSVMAAGGTAVIPLPPRGPHPENLLPASTLTLWAYTHMSDPRWTWGERYILLRQDGQATTPQKIGAAVPDGWGAYVRNGHLFLKLFAYVAQAQYPDRGCSLEVFTNSFMLELETLGPLAHLAPGATVEHGEDWFLFADVPAPQKDADVAATILPLVGKAQSSLDRKS